MRFFDFSRHLEFKKKTVTFFLNFKESLNILKNFVKFPISKIISSHLSSQF